MEFKLWPLGIGGGICDFFWGVFCGELGGKEGGNLKPHFSAELGWKKIVDIKEGFWHISICPTFNRKFKRNKIIFHLQLLLAEC